MNQAQKAAGDFFPGSGPYRRVWSKTGYVGVEATIRLPAPGAMDMREDESFRDVAYTYSGGWGEGGHAVDAGLQHGQMNDDWAVIAVSARQGRKSLFLDAAPRFAAGEVVRLRFEVVGPNRLRLTAESDDGLGPRIIEWGADEEVAGWGRDAKQVFKRMVSIGQAEDLGEDNRNVDRFNSGSTAGPIRWENVRLIKANGSLVPWTSGHGGSHNYPSKAPHDKHFKFVWADFNAETVTIDLT